MKFRLNDVLRAKLNTKLNLCAATVSGLIGASLLLLMGHHPNDDAYITFAHSRNFLETGILAWNPETMPEMGSTAPLFAFILALPAFLTGPDAIPFISLLLNAVLVTVSAPLFFGIIQELTESDFVSQMGALLLSINAYNLKVYSQGFEGALFVFGFMAGLYLIFKKRFATAGLLAGGLPFVRPEGILLSAPFLFFLWMHFRAAGSHGVRAVARPLALYALLPIIWLLLAFFLFGQIFPQSVEAKRMEALWNPKLEPFKSLSGRFDYILQIWSWLLRPAVTRTVELAVLHDTSIDYSTNKYLSGGPFLALALIASFIAGVFALKGKRYGLWYFAYLPFFLVFLFATLRVELWYLPLWNVSAWLLLICGHYWILTAAERRFLSNWKWGQMAVLTLMLALGLSFVFKNFYLINGGTRPFDHMRGLLYVPGARDSDEFERYLAYKKAAEVMNDWKPGTVLTNEIGVFGFYYRRGPILDLFGLATRAPVKIYFERYLAGKPTGVYSSEGNLAVVQGMKTDYLMGAWIHEGWGTSLSDDYELRYVEEQYRVFGDELQIWQRK